MCTKPSCQRSIVEDVTVTSATKDLVGVGTVVHEDICTSAYGFTTISTTIDSGLIAAALHYRSLNVQVCVTGDAAVLVTTVDGILHNGISTLVIDTGYVGVTETCGKFAIRCNLRFTISLATTKDSIDLDS